MTVHIEQVEWDVVPQVGSYIELDNGVRTWLEEDDTHWDLCEFRIPAGGGLYRMAVNVEVTGWTLQHRGYSSSDWARIKLTYVADPLDVDIYTGERQSEDVEVGGWMVVSEPEKVWNDEKAHELLLEEMRIHALREEAERRERAEREARQQAEREAAEQRERELAEAARRAASRAAALEL